MTCANPECAVPLRYLRDGRIFQFEVRPRLSAPDGQAVPAATQKSRRLSHFWLCGRCASALTLVFDAVRGVIVKPRPAA